MRPPAGFCGVGCARRDSDEGSYRGVPHAHRCVDEAEKNESCLTVQARGRGGKCARGSRGSMHDARVFFLLLSLYVYVCMYRERERERERAIV